MALTFLGIGIGTVALLALTRVLASLLFETSPTDLVSFVTSAALFAGVVFQASYVPARRATRIAPAESLRAE